MTLAKKYKFQEVEARLQKEWEEKGLYSFDANKDRRTVLAAKEESATARPLL